MRCLQIVDQITLLMVGMTLHQSFTKPAKHQSCRLHLLQRIATRNVRKEVSTSAHTMAKMEASAKASAKLLVLVTAQQALHPSIKITCAGVCVLKACTAVCFVSRLKKSTMLQ